MRLTLTLLKYYKGGHTIPKHPKPRLYEQLFNNSWHLGRELKVPDLGYKEACLEKGLHVYKPEEIFSPHLPSSNEVYDMNDLFSRFPKKGPFPTEADHPYYHERPAYLYSTGTRLAENMELDQAKALLKTVEIEEGLPEPIIQKIVSATNEEEEIISSLIQETAMFDATQKLLPRNYNVPYIGWNSVNDKMSSRVPYETTMSWQYKLRREYGIPIKKKNMNLMRGILGVYDLSSGSNYSLLQRHHLENTVMRQFIEKDGNLLRFNINVPIVVTDSKPLQPYGDPNATKEITIPNLYPMNPLVGLWPKNVYNPESAFPVKDSFPAGASSHVHTCIDLYNDHIPLRTVDGFHGKSLVNAFVAALGQARNKYGPDLKGNLPEPVTVHYVQTDGRRFHLSVFQLNTLDLEGEDGIKNIFWHQKDLVNLFETCKMEKARPSFSGLNMEVFSKLKAMYLQ